MQPPVLTFARDSMRHVARLGEVRVGEIHEAPGSRRQPFVWLVALVDQRRQGPATSIEDARGRIEDEVNEWLGRIGVLLPGEGVSVRHDAGLAHAR